MGSIITRVIFWIGGTLAGMGIMSMTDKFAADKLPSYPKDGLIPVDASGNWHIPKIAYWIGAVVVGFFLWSKFSRKLKF